MASPRRAQPRAGRTGVPLSLGTAAGGGHARSPRVAHGMAAAALPGHALVSRREFQPATVRPGAAGRGGPHLPGSLQPGASRPLVSSDLGSPELRPGDLDPARKIVAVFRGLSLGRFQGRGPRSCPAPLSPVSSVMKALCCPFRVTEMDLEQSENAAAPLLPSGSLWSWGARVIPFRPCLSQ